MKKNFLFLILLFTIHTVNSQEVKSSIKSVTVYLDGAKVSRSFTVDAKKGTNKIEVKGLSPYLSKDNLQLESSKDIAVLSISGQNDFLLDEKGTEKARQYQDSITNLESLITIENNMRDAYVAEKEVWMRNITKTNATVAEIETKASKTRDAIIKINRNLTKYDKSLYRLKSRLNQFRNQLSDINGNQSNKRSAIQIVFECQSNQKVEFKLNYIVANAGWVALYNMNATSMNAPIDIEYKAEIYNETGVDWKDVDIEISTAEASLDISQPILQTWTIGKFQKDVNLNGYLFNSNSWNNSISSPGVPQAQQGTMIELDLKPITFKISQKYTIVADGNPYVVPIKEIQMDAFFKHYSVPKMESSVYLVSGITDWEKHNLVTGKLNVYLENSFVGNSMLNLGTVEDTIYLSLGIDKKVIVDREEVKTFAKKKLIGNQIRENYEYKISVKNNRTETIDLEIVDQVPVSTYSEIEVLVTELSNSDYNEDTGILSWTDQVAAGSNLQKKLSYTIKYPKNMTIQAAKKRMVAPRYF